MKNLSLALLAMVATTASCFSYAKADVEITWENPKEFRDVKPTLQSRTKFREQTFEDLEEYINKLAEDLPDGQKLTMTVSDLDLAGEVWPSSFVGMGTGGGEVRVVKQLDIPRMTFSYALTDASGTVLHSADEVKLKDMMFMDNANFLSKSDSLRYEKEMIKDWFKDEFPDLIAKK
ncbi:DUF3016 domain-containing protein [Aliiglaciecola sp. 3_MG-2023]|uniref:DUF3016 domain-containing protein n=1 Tax=Aliiglaciecola sp. 3_MG-2023 TaxID=3062644 RepID=UPI0026E1EBEA|nr:DUF3016 domain-containing protein [Aliiglaciecola sp. 3_MG-2023]MDO6692926.1 DUF3016 domain-containing protein [Aliiglaciecola sp. 3_MG-2023]